MIWIFGDSFSVKFGDVSADSPPEFDRYIRLKGYSPKMYYELLSEEYNQEVNNFSRGGMSNDYIFLRFMENYKNINEDDIVIFGWTDVTRFKYVKDKRWVGSNTKPNGDLSRNTIDEIKLNRTNSPYYSELLTTINFIDEVLKENKIIHWSWNHESNKYETINIETNGEIIDHHYSENGHKTFYELLSKQLKESKHIRENLSYIEEEINKNKNKLF